MICMLLPMSLSANAPPASASPSLHDALPIWAYVLDNGRPVVSPHQHPVPIASVAKVMTAYVVLKHYPLQADDSGPRFVVSQEDRKSTRLNSSHRCISYAVFCLKKKNRQGQ